MASLGDKNVALTAEVADGWLPMLFIPDQVKEVWGPALADGSARRAPGLDPLMISAGGPLAIGEGDEILRLRDLARPSVALYVGGMGARGRNFYNDLACRYGYEKEAAEIQDLYLAGNKDEAAALVPQEFLDLTSLIGPRGWVAERVAALREAGVTHLQVTPIPTGDQTAGSPDRRGKRDRRIAAGRSPARWGRGCGRRARRVRRTNKLPPCDRSPSGPGRVAFRRADGGLADRRKLLGDARRDPVDRLRGGGGHGARDAAAAARPVKAHNLTSPPIRRWPAVETAVSFLEIVIAAISIID